MKFLSILLSIVCCANIIENVMARYLLINIKDGMSNNGGHNQGNNPEDPLNRIVSAARNLLSRGGQFRPPDHSGTPACFHGSNLVYLGNGRQKMISDVKVGDSVLAVDKKGTQQFSQVIMHLHKDPEVTTDFRIITTKGGHNMTLTPDHLIYKVEKDTPNMRSEQFVSSSPTFAMNILEGDFVFVLDANKRMIKDEVVANDMVIRKGTYSPVTSHGNIIVNDIAASCYSVYNHQLLHLAFAPFRWFDDAKNFLSNMPSIKNHDYSDKELERIDLHWYAEALLDIGSLSNIF